MSEVARSGHRSNFRDTILRSGEFLGDTLLLAHVASFIGGVLWFSGYASDESGFAIIGGAVAGLLSVFAFSLFGTASWFWGPARFWRSFHPLNLSLAMADGALYYAFFYGKWTAIAVAATVGGLAAAAVLRPLSNHPKAWIALCLVVMLSRYTLPWRLYGIAAAAIAVFIFVAWLTNRRTYEETAMTVENTETETAETTETVETTETAKTTETV